MGVVIPDGYHTTAAAIDRYHESLPKRRSRRLGASSLGEECSRRLWYQFRWAKQEQFTGRMLRLFRRGQREEETVISDLKSIGCVITNTEKNQIELQIAPHIVAYPDGIIESGVPEAPTKPHTLEIKTHSAKSFTKLLKGGIPPKHYAQMQVAMHGLSVTRALYVAVNKDTDELYIERVRYEKEMAEKIIARGQMIVDASEAPIGISNDSSWYKCKFCPMHDVCFKNEKGDRNCRTCAFSTPSQDGTWHCERWETTPPDDVLPVGCDAYVPHPDMHPGEIVDSGKTWAVYRTEDGEVRYGD